MSQKVLIVNLSSLSASQKVLQVSKLCKSKSFASQKWLREEFLLGLTHQSQVWIDCMATPTMPSLPTVDCAKKALNKHLALIQHCLRRCHVYKLDGGKLRLCYSFN